MLLLASSTVVDSKSWPGERIVQREFTASFNFRGCPKRFQIGTHADDTVSYHALRFGFITPNLLITEDESRYTLSEPSPGEGNFSHLGAAADFPGFANTRAFASAIRRVSGPGQAFFGLFKDGAWFRETFFPEGTPFFFARVSSIIHMPLIDAKGHLTLIELRPDVPSLVIDDGPNRICFLEDARLKRITKFRSDFGTRREFAVSFCSGSCPDRIHIAG